MSIVKVMVALELSSANISTSSASAKPPGAVGRSVGAVVLGGDFLGLGIVRSLGRKGVPICVVDDEYSISPLSRFASYAARVPNLRDEPRIVDCLLEIGQRLQLKGWVLYPTREEIVAAVSRKRRVLSDLYRVPTPEWETVKWAWDKRNTYRLANQL
ncbi:MAG TPA: hypothetical protein VF353_02545, partial [Candidatus Binatia bacterium]